MTAPRWVQVLEMVHYQRSTYVNEHPLEFLSESAHGFVSPTAIGADLQPCMGCRCSGM